MVAKLCFRLTYNNDCDTGASSSINEEGLEYLGRNTDLYIFDQDAMQDWTFALILRYIDVWLYKWRVLKSIEISICVR